jgi:hypothetical protein
MRTQEGALTDIVEELRRSADETEGDVVAVGDLVDALDQRGYGPALAILPLVELSPLGGIPGFPTLLALTLAALTIRLLMGYEHFWVPDWLRRRELSSERVMRSMDWLKPVSLRIDATLHERLSRFAGPAGRRAACIVILALLLTVPPLELIPFATSGPMIVIAVFGLGLLFRDGLLMLIGFVAAAIVTVGGTWALFSGGG